jgi:hypothetical protein
MAQYVESTGNKSSAKAKSKCGSVSPSRSHARATNFASGCATRMQGIRRRWTFQADETYSPEHRSGNPHLQPGELQKVWHRPS